MASVVFLHPDLGIGGAERLVVDAALALQKKGQYVHFITSHHDPGHCFTETRDGTIPVTVVGDWLPRNIFGRFYALCAYIRMIYAALYIALFSDLKPDIIFCDLVSVCVPILKLRGYKVIFYCHFPDQLLSQPGSRLKALYRVPLNWMEEITTGKADKILVNSNFTSSVFKATFKRLCVTPDVLYPSINTAFFDQTKPLPFTEVLQISSSDPFIFLSINRYERKKNLELALEALKELQSLLDDAEWKRVYLVIVGGYDTRVVENVDYCEELKDHADKLGIADKMTFMKSPSDIMKCSLLSYAHCLLYTPENEHFGIVPLEAMYARKPVIAVNSGGPKESILNNVTGFLCENTSKAFALAMQKCVENRGLCKKLGEAGRKRVEDKFSFTAFSDELADIVDNLLKEKKKDS
ncbi:alpha-1,3/1,6-mannosyltransferase ALG2 [Anabrus simplex]|uniref:alpha-1,3/1,6-mannosyltransferase ALG2 n=1 Tax=Anabrus simplex TaxID=316456 RepID=UPI0035A2EA18